MPPPVSRTASHTASPLWPVSSVNTPPFRHRLDRVLHEIYEDLLDLRTIQGCLGHLRRKPFENRDAAILEFPAAKDPRFRGPLRFKLVGANFGGVGLMA
jgi:hypothetical protein